MKANAGKSQLRIGFQMMGGDDWRAGISLLRNQLHAIKETYGSQVVLYLLESSDHGPTKYANSIPTDGRIVLHDPKRWSAPWFVNVGGRYLLSAPHGELLMRRVRKQYGINVVCGTLLEYRPQWLGIPTLSWLPDFQHIHMPDMFGEQERLYRDRAFLLAAKRATRVLVFSEAVKNDFQSFAPELAHKVRALHPVSYIPEEVYDQDPSSVLNLYHIPERFVYLPNQFWKHKNHQVVFRAVEALKRRGMDILVVLDGYPMDNRHPSYFADLWAEVSKLNIRDRIIYLGMVPHDHVLMLMRQSVCVLNPSLFEGWGMSVEEARSLGKRTLLSDIPAHREQKVPEAVFFDPIDHEDLASKLAEIWRDAPPGPDLKLEQDAKQSLKQRIETNAKSFITIVRSGELSKCFNSNETLKQR